jgi:hypothetical protein
MSDWVNDARPGLDELVDELVEAHLDTIELAGCCRVAAWDDHLEYVQRLVRLAKHVAAVDAELHR